MNKVLPAVLLSAVLLTSCTTATRTPSSAADTSDAGQASEPQSTAIPQQTPAASPDSSGAKAQQETGGIAVSWILQPTLEADNIDVLCQMRGNQDEQDYNAYRMFSNDGLSLIQQDGQVGLVDYAGKMVVPFSAGYTSIELGYQARYAMTVDGSSYDTLNPDGSISPLGETAWVDVLGTAPNRVVYWWPQAGQLYLNGGADGVLEFPYTSQQPIAALAVEEMDEYDCVTRDSGYLLTDGTAPVGDQHYSNAGAYSCGIIPMCDYSGNWGYLNAAGEPLLSFAYQANWTQPDNPQASLAYPASYGCVVVSRDGQDALYDTQGNCLIDFGSYQELRPVYQDKLWAKQNGKWGVLQLSAPLSDSQTGY